MPQGAIQAKSSGKAATGGGRVLGIYIAPADGAPTQPVPSVAAHPGKGLEGDRYHRRALDGGTPLKPDQEITLIEMEALEALEREKSIHVDPHETRRNVVTRHVALNHLVGREFAVGGVRIKGHRLCEPCGFLESKTRKGVCAGLIHRGGLRAQILSEGVIRVGDSIQVELHETPA